jgi:hypothetical protein
LIRSYSDVRSSDPFDTTLLAQDVKQPMNENEPLPYEALMGYEYPGLIQRLQHELACGEEEALEVVNDTKRFLYLCATVPEPFAPSERIDYCWHAMILDTRRYVEFCGRFFRRFLHHVPKAPNEVAESDGTIMRRTLAAARAVFGQLSANWVYHPQGRCLGDCTRCQGSTNCQDAKCYRAEKGEIACLIVPRPTCMIVCRS